MLRASAFALLAALFLTACGGATTPPIVEKPAPTARDAYIQFVTALHEGRDADAIVLCRASQNQIPALRAMFNYNAVTVAFRDDFIKAYGRQAWDDFQDAKKRSPDADARLDYLTEEKVKAAMDAAVKVDGNIASLTMADGDVIQILQVPGGWLIDAASIVPDDHSAPRFADLFTKTNAAITQYRRAIGKPGIKPEDIDFELGRALAAAHGLTINAPHRFDINAIK